MGIKIKQRDITDCGAACIASVAANYKLKLPVSRIRQIAGTDKKGTNVLGLIKAAEKLGFTAKGVKVSSASAATAEEVSSHNVKQLRLTYRPSQELKTQVEAFHVEKA